MSPIERMLSITECAARVLRNADSPDGPQRIAALVPAVCPECGLQNGVVPDDPAFAGRTTHRTHPACIAATRARMFGERVSA